MAQKHCDGTSSSVAETLIHVCNVLVLQVSLSGS